MFNHILTSVTNVLKSQSLATTENKDLISTYSRIFTDLIMMLDNTVKRVENHSELAKVFSMVYVGVDERYSKLFLMYDLSSRYGDDDYFQEVIAPAIDDIAYRDIVGSTEARLSSILYDINNWIDMGKGFDFNGINSPKNQEEYIERIKVLYSHYPREANRIFNILNIYPDRMHQTIDMANSDLEDILECSLDSIKELEALDKPHASYLAEYLKDVYGLTKYTIERLMEFRDTYINYLRMLRNLFVRASKELG